MKIFVNSLIRWQIGETFYIERVLWIDPSGTDVVTIEITKSSSLPTPKKMADIKDDIAVNRAIVEKEASHKDERKLFNENYVKEYEKRRNEAWKLIEPLVKDRNPAILFPKERGRLITELSKQTGRRKATIYDYLRRYWQNGQTPNALLPRYFNCGQAKERKIHGRKRGRPSKQSLINGDATGINITPEIKELLLKGAEEFYLNGNAHNLKDAWQQTKERYFKKGDFETKDGILVPIIKPIDEIPTFEQFKYYYKKSRDIKKEIVSRYGQNEYDKNKRPLLGNTTTMALGPGSVYQIDATVGDVYLVSYLDRSLIIGKPVIYIVIDVFSRLITGMSITLEGPSWFGAMLALENATTDKVEFCKSFGIEISGEEWPICQLPEAILADRGELIGPKTNVLIEALGIRVANTAVSRPDWKGIVERQFRTLNDTTIHWLPGAVRKKRDKFGKDYRLEAALDLNEFRKIIILSILNYNNNKYIKNYPTDEYMIKDHVEPYPIKLWNYGISCRSGHLRIPPSIIRLILLPREKATITASGIRFKGVL